MRGALEAGGKVVGILADGLERAALNRDHRNFLMDGKLALISPYDPAAGFNVGHSMQRNKVIYALSDAALVVNSDYEKGGTWAGAVEQLEKLHLVPVYVRSNGEISKGLEALRRKGALPWPNPETPEALTEVLAGGVSPSKAAPGQTELFSSDGDESAQSYVQPTADVSGGSALPPADELFATVRALLWKMNTPSTEAKIASDLGVSKTQAREWLQRLVEEGEWEKFSRPVRYGPKSLRMGI
jgi:predicted Rossmann fold nucleotide-binding protein DprA/Smf involved in DNA uptake